MSWKNGVLIFLLLFLLFPFVIRTYSATLQLTKIGALDLGGKMYSEWWYTGTNPTFYGKANSDSDVTLKVGDKSYTARSNGTGDWNYYVELANGDYGISISQGSENISFKLHLGQGLPAGVGSSAPQSTVSGGVPETGYNQTVALTFGLGIILLSSYLYVWGGGSKTAVFGRKIFKD